MSNSPIIDWPAWADSPPGRYILGWEQAQLDRVVSDIFGYHALQLGLPQLDALRENRMPCHALVLDAASGASAPYTYTLPPSSHPAEGTAPSNAMSDTPPHRVAPDKRESLWCDLLELPFEAQSVDLIVMPHTLEFTHNPHLLLREADRILMPEGQLIILGFNSLSLWGARQSFSQMRNRPFIPAAYDLIAFTRLKDWIKLLGFELERGRFGCYRPPLATEKWLARYAFMETAGDRWWPIFGAAYMITAIKRVRGMRLVGAIKTAKQVLAPTLTPVATPTTTHHLKL